MVVNRDAMYETLDKVLEVAPQGGWNQGLWIMHDETCGTVGCFAGWRVVLDGYTDIRYNLDDEIMALRNPDTGECVWPNQIAGWAARSLDLNARQAAKLFYSENTLEDLKRIVDELCAT